MIKPSMMSSDLQQASVIEYRSSVPRVEVMPLHLAAAAAANDDDDAVDNEMSRSAGRQTTVNSVSTYQLMYQQCSSVRLQQVRHANKESRMTSVTTVSRSHFDSAMTSNERHHHSRARHTTSCQDSGYEGTWCDDGHSLASAQHTHHTLSRGCLTVF